jgi:hypothetical protein
MALTSVRSYFRTAMETLGYVEWRDGFTNDNIPSTLLTNSFHIESGDLAPTASNHQVYEFDCPITIRVYLKGYLDPVSAIDDAYTVVEDIYSEILLPSARLGSAIQDVVPAAVKVSPLTLQNDNAVLVEINFNAKTFLGF